MDITTRIKTQVREFPGAAFPFLRFQVGENRSRCEKWPVWDGARVVGYHDTNVPAGVFHMTGCGATLEDALMMEKLSKRNVK